MLNRTPIYFVEVKKGTKAFKVNSQLVEYLKKSLSSKMITMMKKEYVECPVAKQDVVFLVCFNCVSHIRRVKGVVHCEGKEFKLKEV
ncbi:MAG: hypothetical protein QXI27_02500 [Nitrososphaerota archaeon]